MGGCNSICIPRHKNPRDAHENHATPKSLKGNLSTTFCVPNHRQEEGSEPGGGESSILTGVSRAGSSHGTGPQLLNVNTASEEELMTLPGVNRVTAQNIVEYRKEIGGFRKVDDLVLVSGIGAVKLDAIRLEVSVGSRRDSPGQSSARLNYGATSRSLVVVNINEANVFKLLNDVPGISHALAQKIVVHRDKKGPFKTPEDLLSVKGMTKPLYSSIAHQVTVSVVASGDQLSTSDSGITMPMLPRDSNASSQSKGQRMSGGGHHRGNPAGDTASEVATGDNKSVGGKSRGGKSQGGKGDDVSVGGKSRNGKSPGDNLSVGGKSRGGRSTGNRKDSGEMSPHASPWYNDPDLVVEGRTPVKPFGFRRHRRHVVRMATWNLQQCTADKMSNPGVREVICMSILENGLGLIAFQELGGRDIVSSIESELNDPTIPSVKQWDGRKGQWASVTSKATGRMFQGTEYNAFLYDTSQDVSALSHVLIERGASSKKVFTRKPFVGSFQIRGMRCALVCVHLKASGLTGESMGEVLGEVDSIRRVEEAIRERLPNEKDIMIMGDFNISPDVKEFDVLRSNGYSPLIPASSPTNISMKNMKGTKQYDNIWASKQSRNLHTGHYGVIRDGLTSPWIPNGWSWGGLVSDHCPVWAEFYSDKDFDTYEGDAESLRSLKLSP